ncbi:hypothetical protein J6590_036142 [Homalodisca vitripennis]|nr:hypothetical protein J6590_036142 [Homalodisca vitripennis]
MMKCATDAEQGAIPISTFRLQITLDILARDLRSESTDRKSPRPSVRASAPLRTCGEKEKQAQITAAVAAPVGRHKRSGVSSSDHRPSSRPRTRRLLQRRLLGLEGVNRSLRLETYALCGVAFSPPTPSAPGYHPPALSSSKLACRAAAKFVTARLYVTHNAAAAIHTGEAREAYILAYIR